VTPAGASARPGDAGEVPATGQPAAFLAELCDLLAVWVAAAPPPLPPRWSAPTWERFRRAAQVHGVAPLLGRRLQRAAGWPETAAGAWLTGQYAANRRRVERLHRELRAVLDRFAAASVPLMPLKGAVLGPSLYADPGERPMADLDLLVRREHFEQGVALLGELGYEPVFSGRKHWTLARAGDREIVEPDGEHPDNPRPIELHPACGEWLDDTRIELTDLLWGSARQGLLLGAPAWLPDAAAHWLYLLVHATHHILINRFRLIMLLDLVRLEPHLPPGGATGPLAALAFPQLPEAAARALYAPLALLERYFPAAPPDAADRSRLAATLRERLPDGFTAWADGLDLYHACYLDAAPWRPA
jgi:Uncharacterised nucleotidyltransferase